MSPTGEPRPLGGYVPAWKSTPIVSFPSTTPLTDVKVVAEILDRLEPEIRRQLAYVGKHRA